MAGLLAQLKALGLSDAQIAATTIDGKPFHEVEVITRQYRYGKYKSKAEALYAAELDARLRAGEILAWEYEPWSMKLTEARVINGKTRPGVRYTPDFVVVLPDSRIRIVEVKGFQREAAIARFKVAAEKWPCFEWKMVRRKWSGWETIL